MIIFTELDNNFVVQCVNTSNNKQLMFRCILMYYCVFACVKYWRSFSDM